MGISTQGFISNWIAFVQVPIEGQDRYSDGSCFPISDQFVLTSLHIFRNKNHRLRLDQLKVFFRNPDGNTPFFLPPVSGQIVCPDIESLSNEELKKHPDVAVIKLKSPNTNWDISYDVLAHQIPPKNEQFESIGFPIISDKLKRNKATPITGKFLDSRLVDELFSIDVQQSVKDYDDWAGLSGAPIIFNNKIYGVLKQHTRSLNKRFNIVSIPHLLSSRKEGKSHFFDFYKNTYLPSLFERHPVSNLVITKIESLLERNPGVFKKLSLAFGFEGKLSCFVQEYFLNKKVREVLKNFIDFLEAAKARIRNINEFNENVTILTEIAGWLLINSVRPEYVLPEEWRDFDRPSEIKMQERRFFEVVISRELGCAPKFDWGADGDIWPAKETNSFRVYDAFNTDRTEESILLAINKDFNAKTPEKVNDLQSLVRQIESNIRVFLEDKSPSGEEQENIPGFVYYIVSAEDYSLLQLDHIKQLRDSLGGLLRFVVVQEDESEMVSSDNDRNLLTRLRQIMAFKIEG